MITIWDVVIFIFKVKYLKFGSLCHETGQMKTFRTLFVTYVLIENVWLYAFGQNLTEYDRFSLSLGPCLLDISDPCAPDKVLFYLYNSGSGDKPVNLSMSDKTLPRSFDATAPTKILIHGYAGSVDFKGIIAVRKAYQQAGNYNVIVVDWGELVRLPCYPIAVINTIQAGKCIALLLSHLVSLRGPDPGKVHAIGFSLGAHVASFASNELYRLRGERLARITGLDPALPFFASLSPSWKLDKEDAVFVDVIHTNVGVFGKIEATGHVDFYVNEGFAQPACNHAANIPLCSHIMALTYYAESITTNVGNGFWGVPCSSYVQHIVGWCQTSGEEENQILMGEYCDRNSRGVYFVATSDHPPFALGRQP